METRSLRRALAVAVAAQLVIFLLSLPGLGIETRKPSAYAAWAGPVFLVLTILVFVLGIAALAFLGRRPAWASRLGAGQAVAALATNLLDISQVGGPPPPPAPFVLGLLSIAVALVTLGVGGSLAGRRRNASN